MDIQAGDLAKLLAEAAGWPQPHRPDVELANAAETWLLANGWAQHDRMGFVGKREAFSADSGNYGLVLREQHGGYWEARGTAYPVRSFAGALNQLVVLEILPPQFCTYVRDALAARR